MVEKIKVKGTAAVGRKVASRAGWGKWVPAAVSMGKEVATVGIEIQAQPSAATNPEATHTIMAAARTNQVPLVAGRITVQGKEAAARRAASARGWDKLVVAVVSRVIREEAMETRAVLARPWAATSMVNTRKSSTAITALATAKIRNLPEIHLSMTGQGRDPAIPATGEVRSEELSGA